jgi:hypothetical protein
LSTWQDVHGKTPLHHAAERNAVETLTHLVATATRGRLDAQDANGDTALHAAARAGSLEACVYLLQAGADPEVRNQRGHYPWDAATTPRFAGACELLIGTLRAFDAFTAKQLAPRLRGILSAYKPSHGVYPARLRPHLELCAELGLAFTVTEAACVPTDAWTAALRSPAVMARFRIAGADRVRLQQAVLVRQLVYPELAAMGLALTSTPAYRRALADADAAAAAAAASDAAAAPPPAGEPTPPPSPGSPGGRRRYRPPRMPVNPAARPAAARVWSACWSERRGAAPRVDLEPTAADAAWRAQAVALLDELASVDANWQARPGPARIGPPRPGPHRARACGSARACGRARVGARAPWRAVRRRRARLDCRNGSIAGFRANHRRVN